jgi:hypothetical protein
MKTHLGSESIAEWSALRLSRFTPGVTAPRYPLDRRLDGPQRRSGRGGKEKKSLYCPVEHIFVFVRKRVFSEHVLYSLQWGVKLETIMGQNCIE